MSNDPTKTRGGLGAKPPVVAPPPPPEVKPEDPEVKKKLETAAEAERKVRGRASTYLTSAGGIGEANVFRRSLLGN